MGLVLELFLLSAGFNTFAPKTIIPSPQTFSPCTFPPLLKRPPCYHDHETTSRYFENTLLILILLIIMNKVLCMHIVIITIFKKPFFKCLIQFIEK